jgi:hypothetical protein
MHLMTTKLVRGWWCTFFPYIFKLLPTFWIFTRPCQTLMHVNVIRHDSSVQLFFHRLLLTIFYVNSEDSFGLQGLLEHTYICLSINSSIKIWKLYCNMSCQESCIEYAETPSTLVLCKINENIQSQNNGIVKYGFIKHTI